MGQKPKTKDLMDRIYHQLTPVQTSTTLSRIILVPRPHQTSRDYCLRTSSLQVDKDLIMKIAKRDWLTEVIDSILEFRRQ